MAASAISRPFEAGSTGWTLRDLMDPAIEPLWQSGRYEVIEGVLATMPPAFFYAGLCLGRLTRAVEAALGHDRRHGEFAPEADIAVSDDRIVRVDAVFITRSDQERQAAEVAKRDWIEDPRRCPVFIAPTLVIESVSPGHERHDRVTKSRWYAERGIPNYWLLDPFNRGLECWMLDQSQYRIDQSGRESDILRPSLFPSLTLKLGELWS